MSSIIIEIRAGTGGEEAALFAQDLYKMYSKYALAQNWGLTVLDYNDTELGGIKQITFELNGETVWEKMKNEGGVHRVQRVPSTEKSNRIHTSTASVAVLTKPKTEDSHINPSDISMDFFKSSGPGGQNVNKRETAVRLTHRPSGLVVTCQTSRNLEDNKKSALVLLEARLFQQKKEAIDAAISQTRNLQIKDADRSDKIRTYNFPQDRITDHRVNKSWHNMEKILDGRMEKMVDYLQENLPK